MPTFTITIDLEAPQEEWDEFIAQLERYVTGEEEIPQATQYVYGHPMVDPIAYANAMRATEQSGND